MTPAAHTKSRAAALRTVLGLGDRGEPQLEPEPQAAPVAPRAPEVEVVAYAEDCIVSGHLRLAAERLSDLLNGQDSIDLVDVMVEDLAGERPLVLRDLQIARDEILLVHGAGPRGNAARRQHTRQHPIVAKAGPYEVRGYVHALPGSDPIVSLRHRKPMVALTDAVIEYTAGSAPQQRRASVVILNRECVDWIVEGRDEEVVLPELPVDTSGVLLKDFTQQVLE